jgi:cell division protein FtsQ
MNHITEIELGRDHRYMRGKGNIEVRNKRFKKGVVKWLLYLLLFIFALALLSFITKEVYLYLVTTPDLDVRHIDISGNEVVSEETLRASLDPVLRKNILSLDLGRWRERILQNAWIKEVSIKRDLPSTLLVEIKERAPAAFFLWEGKVYLVDAHGLPISSYQEKHSGYDFPFITGLEAASKEDTLQKLCLGIEILENIKKHNSVLWEMISEIHVNDESFFILGLRDGSPALYLDQKDFQKNLDHYFAIKKDIDTQFEKIEHIDLRWKDRVIVKPLEQAR